MEELVTKNSKNLKNICLDLARNWGGGCWEGGKQIGDGGAKKMVPKILQKVQFNEKMKTTGLRGEGELVYWAQSFWTPKLCEFFYCFNTFL